MSTEARHSADNNGWMTPLWLIQAAKKVMGAIDIDPASSPEAQARVSATLWAGPGSSYAQDGLTCPWAQRAFLNPPGGLVPEFWLKLLAETHVGRVGEAIWVGFSLEQLQSLQSRLTDEPHPLAFPTCIPSRRIAFDETPEMLAAREERCKRRGKVFNSRSSPSHANYITYLGARPWVFKSVFAGYGLVINS